MSVFVAYAPTWKIVTVTVGGHEATRQILVWRAVLSTDDEEAAARCAALAERNGVTGIVVEHPERRATRYRRRKAG